MGELIVNMFITLDGVVQAPGGPDEDVESGFQQGGWQAPHFDEDSGRVMFEDMAHLDALLLGRKTYEIFAAYWPQGPEETPFTALLNNAPKHVASRTLEAVEWNNSHLIQGEIADEVPRLKEQYGKIHVSGSAELVQTLLRHDLVDQLNLWVYPIVLGTGKKLFPEGAVPAALELLESATFGNTVLLRYRRAGIPTYGNMASDAE